MKVLVFAVIEIQCAGNLIYRGEVNSHVYQTFNFKCQMSIMKAQCAKTILCIVKKEKEEVALSN